MFANNHQYRRRYRYLALGLGSWLQSTPQSASSCQALYTKVLADDYREKRLMELALKDGLSEGKISRLLQDGKVLHRHDSNYSNTVLVFGCGMTCKPIFSPQVPTNFSFVDLHPTRGLNEDMVILS